MSNEVDEALFEQARAIAEKCESSAHWANREAAVLRKMAKELEPS